MGPSELCCSTVLNCWMRSDIHRYVASLHYINFLSWCMISDRFLLFTGVDHRFGSLHAGRAVSAGWREWRRGERGVTEGRGIWRQLQWWRGGGRGGRELLLQLLLWAAGRLQSCGHHQVCRGAVGSREIQEHTSDQSRRSIWRLALFFVCTQL